MHLREGVAPVSIIRVGMDVGPALTSVAVAHTTTNNGLVIDSVETYTNEEAWPTD
jgi:hypothetical protein